MLSFSKEPSEKDLSWCNAVHAFLIDCINYVGETVVHVSFSMDPDYGGEDGFDVKVLVYPMFSIGSHEEDIVYDVEDMLLEFEDTELEISGKLYETPFCSFGWSKRGAGRMPVVDLHGPLFGKKTSIALYVQPLNAGTEVK